MAVISEVDLVVDDNSYRAEEDADDNSEERKCVDSCLPPPNLAERIRI